MIKLNSVYILSIKYKECSGFVPLKGMVINMKVVILTTATGQGHNSAAAAVANYLETRGCEAVVTDVLKTGKKDASGPVSALYDKMVTYAPWVFGMLYHAGELISSCRHHSPIYYLNTLYAAGFMEKLGALHADVIVCPHLFSGQALTYLKQKGMINTPAVSIQTDYTCSPFWEETRLEKYIIPSPLLFEEFARKGIPREKLVPVGIPVDARFKKKYPKEQAREMLGIHSQKVFAVMGGSMGYGEIPKIVEALHGRMPDALVVAACGNNQKLFEKLQGIKNVMPLKYTKDINIVMDAADVLVTKPGGLSSTEAAVKRVPLVFSRPIPGGEARNAEFFASLKMAAVAKTPSAAAASACEIAENPALMQQMVDAQEKYIDRDADEHIGDIILGLV
jgi:processive 1,2-diacylglycerol beta-glucosyltransferase